MPDKSLAGRTALITGASAGLGWAFAEHLAAAGAGVVVNARREAKLAELVANITAAGGRAVASPGDAGQPNDIDRVFDRATQWAQSEGCVLDIVIANAGRGLAGGLLSSDRTQWEQMIQVNVLGATHLMRRAAEAMVPRGRGDIVAIGSVVGRNVSPFSGYYGSTKFALIAAAEALRREIATACGSRRSNQPLCSASFRRWPGTPRRTSGTR